MADSVYSTCFACVVLPEPGRPQTRMSLGLLWRSPVNSCPLNLEFLVVLDQRERNKSEHLISTSRWNMRRVTPSANLRVLHSRSLHDIEYLTVHQCRNAFALMRWMNCIQSDFPGLPVLAHFVVDESHYNFVLFRYREPVLFRVA